jgi:hypothetical protein
VPKAAIHEHREFLAVEIKIRPPWNILWMLSPAKEFRGAQCGLDNSFCGAVSGRPYFCHPSGALAV